MSMLNKANGGTDSFLAPLDEPLVPASALGDFKTGHFSGFVAVEFDRPHEPYASPEIVLVGISEVYCPVTSVFGYQFDVLEDDRVEGFELFAYVFSG